jgi:hypothetical protein
MTDDYREELISTAFDGESVDVEALRDALSTTDGRDALASLLLLRAAMAADTTQPPTQMAGAATATRVRERVWSFGVGSRIPLGVAASIAALLVAGSFWLGTSWPARGIGSVATQPARQTLGTVAAPPTSVQPPASHQLVSDDGVPPTPTRVLRYTPGVDWHQTS